MRFAKNRSLNTWYRGTLRYDAATDSLHIWPSALVGSTWTVYHTVAKLSELLELLKASQPADFRNSLFALKSSNPAMLMP